jgi:BA14K-like protein
MKSILVTASAAVFSVLAITATTAPANAFTVTVGGWGGPGWGYHGGWGPGYGGGYYPTRWERHVEWCFDHKGPSYNPRTNRYINFNGHRRVCHSPFA